MVSGPKEVSKRMQIYIGPMDPMWHYFFWVNCSSCSTAFLLPTQQQKLPSYQMQWNDQVKTAHMCRMYGIFTHNWLRFMELSGVDTCCNFGLFSQVSLWDSTMVNHHERTPFERICLVFFRCCCCCCCRNSCLNTHFCYKSDDVTRLGVTTGMSWESRLFQQRGKRSNALAMAGGIPAGRRTVRPLKQTVPER